LLSLAAAFTGFAGALAQPDYPSAHWNPPACVKYYSSGNGHKFCVIHDMEGYYQTSVSYLNRCDTDTNGVMNVQASVYYLVNGLKNGNDEDGNVENLPADADVGDITQSVRESNYAWHVRCWNTWMFGTEHEGFVTSPAWYTEGMYVASAALQRYLCDKYGIPKDRNHIIGHNEWQNSTWTNWMAANFPAIDTTCNNHTDPGQYWDWTHFMTLITGAAAITRQPYSLLVETGSNATFTVVAAGSNTLKYAWSKNGSPIAGATLSAYTISNVQPTNAGGYSVVVTNALGAVTSRVATLTVSPAWVLAFADDFETSSAARWNLFWGAGNGVSDFTTNWAFNYGASHYVSNGVTSFIPSAPNSAGTTHGLKITCNKNDATGSPAGVSLYPKNLGLNNNYVVRFDLWINYNGGPGGGSGSTEYASCGLNHTGTRVNWSTSATSSDGLWFAVDGEGGSGGTDYRAYQGNSAAAPTQLSFANSGLGTSGAGGDHYSDHVWQGMFPATTYETAGAPGKHWVQGELSQVGTVITWQINGVVVAQRTNATSYTSGDVMIGYFDAFSSIANPAADNFAIFDNVRVLVLPIAPVMTSQPQSLTVTQAANATFSAAASGNPVPGYQWRFGGAAIAGATGAAYTRTNAQPGDAGSYSVVASNLTGGVTSSIVVLTVLVPPAINLQPQSQTTNQGGTASFSISATGDAPLGYRWQFNGAYTGTTGTNYILSNVQPANAGSYRCIVTNAVGTATSTVATLTVNVPPAITNQPQSQTLKAGTNATFSLVAGGTAPLGYQWRFNGADIAAAHASSYTRSGIQTNDAGSYSVVVTNLAGSITSSNAVLTVIPLLPLKFDLISSLPDGQVRLVLSGEPGNYAVGSSSNLTDWLLWTNVTIGSGPLELLDSGSNGLQRFYRASPVP
jgi:N-acetyl-anhydromuramyl-L-alanine amidase AmpD